MFACLKHLLPYFLSFKCHISCSKRTHCIWTIYTDLIKLTQQHFRGERPQLSNNDNCILGLVTVMWICIALNGNDMSHKQSRQNQWKIPKLLKFVKNVKNTQNCDECLIYKLFMIISISYYDIWSNLVLVDHRNCSKINKINGNYN